MAKTLEQVKEFTIKCKKECDGWDFKYHEGYTDAMNHILDYIDSEDE